DLPLVGDDLADLAHIILGEVLDARVAVHPRVREDVVRPRAADAENVSQTDFHALIQWEVDACDSCHLFLRVLRPASCVLRPSKTRRTQDTARRTCFLSL